MIYELFIGDLGLYMVYGLFYDFPLGYDVLEVLYYLRDLDLGPREVYG